jgi:hypothetical protein
MFVHSSRIAPTSGFRRTRVSPASRMSRCRGAELAIDYYNEKCGVAGGRELKLSVEDSQGRLEGGVAAYRRLVSEEHAIGVTGFFHSSVNLAVNEAAKAMGVPIVRWELGTGTWQWPGGGALDP